MNDRMTPGATEQSFLKHNSVLNIIETNEIRKLSDISKLPSEQPERKLSKDINALGSTVMQTLANHGVNIQKIGATAIAKAESGIKQATGKDVNLGTVLTETNAQGALAGSLIGGVTLSASNIIAGAAAGSMIDKTPEQESVYPRQPARVALDTERATAKLKEPFTRYADKGRVRHSIRGSKPVDIIDVAESFISDGSIMPYSANNVIETIDNTLNNFKRKVTGHNKYPKNNVEQFCTTHWNGLSTSLVVLILILFVLMLSQALYKCVSHVQTQSTNTSTKALVYDTKQRGGRVDVQSLIDIIKKYRHIRIPKLEGGMQSTSNQHPVILKPHLEKQYTADEMREQALLTNDSSDQYNGEVF